MANVGNKAECVVEDSLEEDEEIAWINSATWNDSLWVENNFSWELDEGGHFCNRKDGDLLLNCTTKEATPRIDNGINFFDTDAHQSRLRSCWQCEQNVESCSSEDSGACDFIEDEFFVGAMYENYTDDIKLSLVNTLLSRHRPTREKIHAATVKPCCDQKYIFREKCNFLRRSSPSSSVSPSSRVSSKSSLESTSRQSRSLSPQLLRQTVEAYRADLAKGKVYRDCCNNSNGHRSNSLSPHQSVSPKNGKLGAQHSRKSSPGFNGLKSHQSRSQSPLAVTNDKETSDYPDLAQSKLPQRIYYGRGFKMKQKHSVISSSGGKHVPRLDFPINPPMRFRSNSPSLLSPQPSRKSRSLSPQLIRAIDAHKTELSQRVIYRDCCSGHHQVQTCKGNPNGIKPSSQKMLTRPLPRQFSSSPNVSHRITTVERSPTKNPTNHHQSRCLRPCCQKTFSARPKFNYLRKGSGIKRYTHIPKSPNGRQHSPSPQRQLSPLAKTNTHPSKTQPIYANNNISQIFHSRSPNSQLFSPISSQRTSTPMRITLKHPSLDESDGKDNHKQFVVCDEVLLEFPSLYYKLDCSGHDGDADLESRKAKTGTVYRILDDGNVVRECDLDKDTPKLPDEDGSGALTQPTDPFHTSTDVPQDTPVNQSKSTPSDDLSDNRAFRIIHDLTPEDIADTSDDVPLSTEVLSNHSDNADVSHLDSDAADNPLKDEVLQQSDSESSETAPLHELVAELSVPDDENKDASVKSNSPNDNPCISEGASRTNSHSGEDSMTPESPVQQMEDDSHFRPISRSSEYSSDSYSNQGLTETDTTKPRTQILGNADCTFQPIESVVGSTCTPLELCNEMIIRPQVCRKPNEKLLSQELVAPVTDLQSPLQSCEDMEQRPLELKHLEDSLEAGLVPEIEYYPEPNEVSEETIVPGERLNIERPVVNEEPSIDQVEINSLVSAHSDTKTVEVSLVEAGKIDAIEIHTAQMETLCLLESCAVDQCLTYLSPCETDDSSLQCMIDDVQSKVKEVDQVLPDVCTVTIEFFNAEVEQPNIQSAPAISFPSPSDSDAFDGDESSEGEESEPHANLAFRWPSAELEAQHSLHDRLSPPSGEFERESSVDTVRSPLPTETVKHATKTGTGRRKRKTRHKTLSSSPKPQGDTPPSSPKRTFPSKDLNPTNQLSPSGSPDVSADDDVASDQLSSDNDGFDNSAGLSEGSNWDYYQARPVSGFTCKDPPYSTGTEPEFDVDLEPKLDDSVLQWDDELDINTDTLTLDVSPRDPQPHVVGGAAAARQTSDSEDSDIEDLHYVIQQSSTQLLQADSALRKPRRDVVQCGIYLDPHKYNEWHATCQTNIKCLQVIQEHLDSEQGLANLTDDDIQQVLDLIKKWQSLEKIALERKEQSTSLCKIYRDIQAGRKQVKLCEDQLSMAAFNDVGELENHFRSLQTFKVNLQSHSHRLQQVTDSIIVFESENKKIKMAGFKQLVAELHSSIKPTVLNIGRTITELQYAIVRWHKWNKDCKDLEAILVKTLYDIEPSELSLCENRLVELEALFSEYSSVCTEVAHNSTEEKLASLRARLNHLVSESVPAANDVEQILEDDDQLDNDAVSEGLTLEQAYERSSYPVQDSDFVVSSQLSPPPSLFLDSAKLDSHKSSMESGFVTMDTETSAGDGSSVGLHQAAVHVVPCQDVEELQRIDSVAAAKPYQSLIEVSCIVADADTTPSLPPADIVSKSTDDYNFAVPLDDDLETVPPSMAPLAVDVSQDNGPLSSDHQTPPTVEELAPTLPITDQEKINVANRSKRNRRSRRRGKNKAATNTKSQATPVASSSKQTRPNLPPKLADSVNVGSTPQQTVDQRMLEQLAVEQKTDGQQTDGQQTDGQQTVAQKTDGQQTDGQQTDRQQTDGQQTDEQQTDEQQTDGQQTVAQKTVAQKTVAQKTDGQQTDGQQTDVQQTDGQQTDGQQTVAQKTDGQQTDGQQTVAQKTVAQKTVAQKTDGQQTDGQQTDVQQTDGQQTDGQQTVAQKTDGQQTDGQQTVAQKTVAQKTDGQQTDGQQTDGQQKVAQKTDGQQTDGQQTDGQQIDRQQTDGQQTVGQQTGGQQTDGQQTDGQQEVAQQTAGQQTDEQQTVGQQMDEQQVVEPETVGQQADGEQTFAQQTDGQQTVGQQTDGQQTVAQQTDGQQTDGQQTVAQQTDGQQTVAQQTDGQQTVGQQTNGQKTVAQQTDGEQTFAQQTDGQQTAGRQTDGKQTFAHQTDGQQTVAQQTNGQQVVEQESVGQRTEGQQTDGQQVVEQQTDEEQMFARQTFGQQTYGQQTDERLVFEQETVGQQTDGQQTVEQETAGQQTVGQQTVGQQSVEQQTDEKQTFAWQTVGQQTYGQQTVEQEIIGQQTVEQQTVGQQTVGQQTYGQQTDGQQTVGQQTEDAQFTSSFTNTAGSSSSQAQTDPVETADQSTHSRAPPTLSQGVLTDASTTSFASNQTDGFNSSDQYTETDSPSDLSGSMSTRSTNTHISCNTISQTEVTIPSTSTSRKRAISVDSCIDYIDSSDINPSSIAVLDKADVSELVGDEQEPAEENAVGAATEQDVDALPLPIDGDALLLPIDGDALPLPIDGDALPSPTNGDEMDDSEEESETIASLKGEAIQLADLDASNKPEESELFLPDEGPQLGGPLAEEELAHKGQGALDEPVIAEGLQQFELVAEDEEMSADDDTVDLHMHVVPEDEPLQQSVLRQRIPEDISSLAVNMEAKAVGGDVNTKLIAKPKYRKGWLSSRALKYIALATAAIIFFLALLFLLGPSCCENTRYHKGIFGLRRKYSDLPPH